MWLPQSFIAVLFAVLAQGALTNTTIDDTTFTFGGTWTALSTKSPCTSTPTPCPPQPDPSQTFGETWHVGTIHPGAPPSVAWGSFSFKGSAVYIFGIDQAGQAEIDFVLDQINNPDIHKHQYTGTQQFAYDVLFFSATGLSDQRHTVYWGLKATGNAVQSALFDYAVVTSGEEGMPTTPGGGTNSGSATTSTTTPSSSEVPSEPVTASATPSRTGSNAMSSLTGQGHSTGNESQPGSGASQPTPTPPSAPATSSLTPTHHPTSSGTHTDTGSGGSTPGTPQLTSSSSKSKTNVGAIAGEVIGAVFAALVIIFVWLRCRKVRRLAADPASGSRFLRIEDYYAMQDASPPSSTHQVNPFPVSVDRSVFKGEHLHNNSETGLTGPSAASVLPPTDAHSDLFPFPQSEPAATDTSHYQGRPSADEGMIGNARSTSTDSRPSISSSEDND